MRDTLAPQPRAAVPHLMGGIMDMGNNGCLVDRIDDFRRLVEEVARLFVEKGPEGGAEHDDGCVEHDFSDGIDVF